MKTLKNACRSRDHGTDTFMQTSRFLFHWVGICWRGVLMRLTSAAITILLSASFIFEEGALATKKAKLVPVKTKIIMLV